MKNKESGETVRKICPRCGKPAAGGQRLGSLTAFLFGTFDCSCSRGGEQKKSSRSLQEGSVDEVEFCPKCGLPIATAARDGSLTGFLFQNTRCKCPPDKAFADGQMSSKFWKLKQASVGTVFIHSSGEDEGNGSSGIESIGLAPGATIGGAYKVMELIGRGGMGEVYLAKHEMLGKKCALKVIPPEQVTEMGWQRFQLEARAVAKLEHINLVRVTDLGIHEGCLPFYAMDYVHGRTLAEIIANSGPMSLSTAVDIFMQVCDGVDCAHRSGILHRDLKPANIMVMQEKTGRNVVKILDFGLAKLTNHDRNKQSLTAIGDVFGSPFYMSPEQCKGDKLDRRSDIYSIGCTMFECLTGQPPFTGHLPAAVIFSQLEAAAPSLESVVGRGRYPASIEIVIAKILRKNPVERYQALVELRSDLEKVARGEEVEPFYVSRQPQVRAHSVESEAKAGGNLAGQADKTAYATKTIASVLVACTFLFMAWAMTHFLVSLVTPKEDALYRSTRALYGLNPPEKTSRTFSLLSEPGNSALPAVPPPAARLSTPYSSIVTEGGRKWRVFNFPVDVSIGSLYADGLRTVSARGLIKFPLSAQIGFTPAPIAIKYPALLKRFRKGDLVSISLALEFDAYGSINAALAAVSLMPGIVELNLNNEEDLNDIGVDSILKMDSLKRISMPQSIITKTILTKLTPQLKHMELISFPVNFDDVTPLLKSLAGSKSITSLFLDSSSTTMEGIAILSALPRLERLSLGRVVPSNADSTSAALKLLSKSPNLRMLTIKRLPMSLDTVATLEPFRNRTLLELDVDESFIRPLVQNKIMHDMQQRGGTLNLRINGYSTQAVK